MCLVGVLVASLDALSSYRTRPVPVPHPRLGGVFARVTLMDPVGFPLHWVPTSPPEGLLILDLSPSIFSFSIGLKMDRLINGIESKTLA